MEEKEKSNIILIKEFFMPGEKSMTVLGELKALSDEEKKQLGEGIRNGTFTY